MIRYLARIYRPKIAFGLLVSYFIISSLIIFSSVDFNSPRLISEYDFMTLDLRNAQEQLERLAFEARSLERGSSPIDVREIDRILSAANRLVERDRHLASSINSLHLVNTATIFALSVFFGAMVWFFGSKKKRVVIRYRDAMGYKGGKRIGSTVGLIRKRARYQSRLAVFTLILSFAFLGVGFYVFFDPQSVGSSQETALRDVHRVGEQIRRDLNKIEDSVSLGVRNALDQVSVLEEKSASFQATVQTLLQEQIKNGEDVELPIKLENVLTLELETAANRFSQLQTEISDVLVPFSELEPRIEEIRSNLREILATGEGGAFDANFAENMVKRLGAIVFLFFTITILMTRFRNSTEISAHYESLADTIELVHSSGSEKQVVKDYARLFDLAQTPKFSGNEPKNPGDEILATIKDALVALASKANAGQDKNESDKATAPKG